MPEIGESLAWQLTMPWPVMLARMVVSIVLAGMIGIEREIRNSAAGMRTHMLVGLAAATYCILTLEMVAGAYSEKVHMDPLRLVEAVTGGVAFLAAGMIVFSKGEVRGLTTGASMWLAAAIGLAAGLGLWPIAVAATVFGLVIARLSSGRLGKGPEDPADGA